MPSSTQRSPKCFIDSAERAQSIRFQFVKANLHNVALRDMDPLTHVLPGMESTTWMHVLPGMESSTWILKHCVLQANTAIVMLRPSTIFSRPVQVTKRHLLMHYKPLVENVSRQLLVGRPLKVAVPKVCINLPNQSNT
jgi:hypothetical protein